MSTVVVYRSKYGATKKYAEWIAEALNCKAIENKNLKIEDLLQYDTIIYGGGLYAEVIDGVTLITKNLEKLENKKIIIFSTGITPLKYTEYYDKLVIDKNFKPEMLDKIKIYNFMGKMIIDELSGVHRAALKTLKQIMSAKKNPNEMEKLLIELCETSGDFTDKNAIKDLVDYAK